jgi:hypothetical protein
MQMQQHGGQGSANIQQAAAPAHIQSVGSGSGALSDLYRGGSIFDAPPPQRQDVARQQQQQQQATTGGNTLSSLRHQYMNRTKDTIEDEPLSQPFQNSSRPILGEDIALQKAPASKAYQPPGTAAHPQPMQQAPQQEPLAAAQEQPIEQEMPASDDVSRPAEEANQGVDAEPEN